MSTLPCSLQHVTKEKQLRKNFGVKIPCSQELTLI